MSVPALWSHKEVSLVPLLGFTIQNKPKYCKLISHHPNHRHRISNIKIDTTTATTPLAFPKTCNNKQSIYIHLHIAIAYLTNFTGQGWKNELESRRACVFSDKKFGSLQNMPVKNWRADTKSFSRLLLQEILFSPVTFFFINRVEGSKKRTVIGAMCISKFIEFSFSLENYFVQLISYFCHSIRPWENLTEEI